MCVHSLITIHFVSYFFDIFFYAVAFMLTGSIFLQILHKTIADPPRKRVDTRPSKSYRTEMLANGSPIAPRRFPYGYVVVYMLIIIAFILIFFLLFFSGYGFFRINSYSSTKVYINCTPNRSFNRRNGNMTTANDPMITNNNNNTTTTNNTNHHTPHRHPSHHPGVHPPHHDSTNNLLVSPLNCPKTPHHINNNNNNSNDELGVNTSPVSPISQPYWKSRLNTLKNSFLGTPRFDSIHHFTTFRISNNFFYSYRFHRRAKMQIPLYEDVALATEPTPDMTKKSWFGNLMGNEREETHVLLIKDKPLSVIKADLIHTFLSVSIYTLIKLFNFLSISHIQVPDLSHTVLSPMSFRLDYRRPGGTTSMFQRNIRIQVDIACATPPSNDGSIPSPNFDTSAIERPTIYCITFTLISGKFL